MPCFAIAQRGHHKQGQDECDTLQHPPAPCMLPTAFPDFPYSCYQHERQEDGTREDKQRGSEAHEDVVEAAGATGCQQEQPGGQPERFPRGRQQFALLRDERPIECHHQPSQQTDALRDQPPAEPPREDAGPGTQQNLEQAGRQRGDAEHPVDPSEKERMEERLPEELIPEPVAGDEVRRQLVVGQRIHDRQLKGRIRAVLKKKNRPDREGEQEDEQPGPKNRATHPIV
ncbi:MAG: hypothetical protein BWY59_02307 [Verrucomicrobia bacterium ADurb.Bin345]|nr:MAG: hypothetical protein BWY59_02307 [Verrucomicrobia bacterium ADurb.Bin345]